MPAIADALAGTTSSKETAAGAKPLTAVDLSNVYILYYRHGNNPNCQTGFQHKGDMRSAVERAKKHCELMGYRYIYIRPFIVDMTATEVARVESFGG